MNILFLSMQAFQDIIYRSTYHDLLQTFCQEGHELYVMAPGPELKQVMDIEGLHYVPVNIPSIPFHSVIESSYLTKRSEYIFMETFKNKLSNLKFDLILYSTVPAVFLRLINYVKMRDGALAYLLLKNPLIPKEVEIGVLTKHSLNYWYLKARERKFIKRADYIGLSRPSMVDFYKKKYQGIIASQRFEYSPLGINGDSPSLSLLEKKVKRKQYGLPLEKVIFIYKGNLNRSQQLKPLIQAIERNLNNEDFFLILLVGGKRLNELQTYLHENRVSNAILIPDLSNEKIGRELLNLSDVGLIINEPLNNNPVMQEELLLYLRASLAILAMDNNPDMQALLFKGQVGYASPYGDIDHFNHLISLLCLSDLRLALGNNGQIYLRRNYNPSLTYQAIMKHFEPDLDKLELGKLVLE